MQKEGSCRGISKSKKCVNIKIKNRDVNLGKLM